MSNVIEQGVKGKVRFQFRGQISTEGLYELTEAELDSIYKELSLKAQASSGQSLLQDNSVSSRLTLKMDIVRHVFETKRNERLAAEQKVENAAKKQKMLEVLQQKQNAALLEMSAEDIQKMIDSM
jgi:predicted amidohydrolase